MGKVTGAKSFVETLAAHGIKHVFGNPGSSVTPILDEINGSGKVSFHLGLQETSVIGMADGYAKAARTPAVALVHTIPGLSNCLGGIYNAYIDGTPLVIVAGNQDSEVMGRGAFCEAPDLPGLPRQLVKFAQEVTRGDRVSEILSRALRVASARPSGPCFLSIAKDVQTASVEDHLEAAASLQPLAIRPDREKVKQAAELLLQAERPVIIAGYNVAKDASMPQLLQLAELLGCPVFSEERTNLGGLSFPSTHPQHLGVFEPDHALIKNADVILAIGKKLFAEYSYSPKSRLPLEAKLIHLHDNPWEIGKMHLPFIGLQADTRSGVADLCEALEALASENSNFIRVVEKRKQEVAAVNVGWRRKLESQAAAVGESVPIQPHRLAKEVGRLMGPGTTIVNEATRAKAHFLNYIDFIEPQSLFCCPGGYLGWGLPAAVGIKLALPQRKVVACLGDGASLYAIQALWSAVKYNLPVIAVICNNASYLAVKAHMNSLGGYAARTGVFEGADLTPRVNFARVAEGFGARGYTVTGPDQLRPTLEEAFAKEETAVIDVIIDDTVPEATR